MKMAKLYELSDFCEDIGCQRAILRENSKGTPEEPVVNDSCQRTCPYRAYDFYRWIEGKKAIVIYFPPLRAAPPGEH